jgi:hypothetical protein
MPAVRTYSGGSNRDSSSGVGGSKRADHSTRS